MSVNTNTVSRKKQSNKFIKIINVLMIIAFVLVVVFMGRVAIFKTSSGIDLIELQENRMIKEETLYAERGGIYDVNGVPIAQTHPSYNLYAVLDEKYSTNIKKEDPKLHVTNPEAVAQGLSPIIQMDVADMLAILKTEGAFQVEFAPYGNLLSQTQKDQITALNLEGVYFTSQDSRRYPQGQFASNTIGYASYEAEQNHLIGKMGVESALEQWLIGQDGYHIYQTNIYGQKINQEQSERLVEAVDGYDVYLTLDANIQRILESSMEQVQAKHQPTYAVVAVADPKTGAILGVAQTPSFDPNTKDITDFTNYLVAEYEVGSIMKTITYASAVDTGNYNGQATLQTGSYEVDGWTIRDWNNGNGWGTISYDDGLCHSSNTAIANVVKNYLTEEEQKAYLRKFGFGQSTNLGVPGEDNGTIIQNSLVERVTTGYGQGTTASLSQMIEAYNAIANNGNMMQLHLVDKIVDPKSGDLKFDFEPVSKGQPITAESANYVKALLTQTMNSENCSSGTLYQQKNFTFAGKTGTANVADPRGGYLASYDSNYNYSYAGMAPAEDPQFVIISSVHLPQVNPKLASSTIINSVVDPINSYLNIVNRNGGKSTTPKQDEATGVTTVEAFPSFLNRRKEDAIDYMNYIQGKEYIFIGNGDTIVNQNITPYAPYISTQRVIIRLDGAEITVPNFTGWSRKDIEAYGVLSGVVIEIQGEGYVIEQNLAEGTIINEENNTIVVKLMV